MLQRTLRFASAFAGCVAVLLCWCSPATAAANNNPPITIMTRNVDAGTDMGYIVAAMDAESLAQGTAATVSELVASNFQARAAAFAAEVAATKPDLIALQEVTLWRTGPLMAPPATDTLYDQLDLILAEFGKRSLHYGVVAVQAEFDAEAPVPSRGFDIRMTDQDVILVRRDAPQTQFDLVNIQSHRFRSAFSLGSPVLGQLTIPCGWMAVDVTFNGSKFRFVNTHLQSPIEGIPEATQVQLAQADELLTSLLLSGMPVVLAGDFNSNAEIGPEHTGTAQKIVRAGYADTWDAAHPNNPGYTWPLFGEDQKFGPTVANERIDLVFVGGVLANWFGKTPTVESAEKTGAVPP